MLHVHGSTSATRLNSGISMIMASMYKIPQEQCPLPLKSPPSNHWHYCSVLPRESFHCRSAHRPNDRSEQSDPGRYASISLSRTSGCSASVTCSLLHASPTTVPAVLCDSNTGASAVPAYKGQASSNKPP